MNHSRESLIWGRIAVVLVWPANTPVCIASEIQLWLAELFQHLREKGLKCSQLHGEEKLTQRRLWDEH